MRIISGKFRGKKLADSNHLLGLRPTTDKNREALFNILCSGKVTKKIGFKLADSEILDVCCGTGSVGFECLSRDAKSVFLIDDNQIHLTLAKKNAELLNITAQCKFLLCDVKENLPESSKSFDLVFIDPPYCEDYQEILAKLHDKKWLTAKSLIVCEFKTGQENQIDKITFLKQLESRKYGKTTFVFCQLLDNS